MEEALSGSEKQTFEFLTRTTEFQVGIVTYLLKLNTFYLE